LEAGCSSFSPEELQDFHRDIRQSALRLHRTVRNYLLMLELQNDDGREERPPPLLPFAEIQDGVRNGVDFVLQRHNRAQDLSLELADCPLCVRREDFVRIIEEILDNAFKFSRSGTPVVLRLTPEGKLSMEDEGRGMTEEEIRQVGAFRQFNRKKQEQQGLGLGLALVQKLVERNGGRCDVARRPEAGIEVAVWFAKSIADDLGETSAPKHQVAQLAF
jgi:signal transduction histidine kinase